MLRPTLRGVATYELSKVTTTLLGQAQELGGVAGYHAAETTDESPEKVSVVQRLTWAYLRSALYSGDSAWSTAQAAFAKLADLGRLECK